MNYIKIFNNKIGEILVIGLYKNFPNDLTRFNLYSKFEPLKQLLYKNIILSHHWSFKNPIHNQIWKDYTCVECNKTLFQNNVNEYYAPNTSCEDCIIENVLL